MERCKAQGVRASKINVRAAVQRVSSLLQEACDGKKQVSESFIKNRTVSRKLMEGGLEDFKEFKMNRSDVKVLVASTDSDPSEYLDMPCLALSSDDVNRKDFGQTFGRILLESESCIYFETKKLSKYGLSRLSKILDQSTELLDSRLTIFLEYHHEFPNALDPFVEFKRKVQITSSPPLKRSRITKESDQVKKSEIVQLKEELESSANKIQSLEERVDSQHDLLVSKDDELTKLEGVLRENKAMAKEIEETKVELEKEVNKNTILDDENNKLDTENQSLAGELKTALDQLASGLKSSKEVLAEIMKENDMMAEEKEENNQKMESVIKENKVLEEDNKKSEAENISLRDRLNTALVDNKYLSDQLNSGVQHVQQQHISAEQDFSKCQTNNDNHKDYHIQSHSKELLINADKELISKGQSSICQLTSVEQQRITQQLTTEEQQTIVLGRHSLAQQLTKDGQQNLEQLTSIVQHSVEQPLSSEGRNIVDLQLNSKDHSLDQQVTSKELSSNAIQSCDVGNKEPLASEKNVEVLSKVQAAIDPEKVKAKVHHLSLTTKLSPKAIVFRSCNGRAGSKNVKIKEVFDKIEDNSVLCQLTILEDATGLFAVKVFTANAQSKTKSAEKAYISILDYLK